MNPAAYNLNSISSSSFHFLDLNEDHGAGYEQYGLTTNHQVLPQQAAAASSSSTCPTFFSLTQDYQSGSQCHQTQLKVDEKINGLGSSDGPVLSASSNQPTNEDSTKDHMKMFDHENGSMKWMSSKMRMMRKNLYMPSKSINDNHSNQINSADDHCNSSTAEIVRVCSDCNTTKTPLWRGGPQGPKTLCNACGIRQRKARKAAALAAAAQNDTDIVNKMEYYSSKSAPKIHNKEKKLRTSYHDVPQSHQTTATSKLSFDDFAMSLINRNSNELFPRDEEEAAILLMALSCGLIHRHS